MTVALLGTGIMGTGMARSMHRAGLPVRVWNRTAEKAAPLRDEGIEVHEDLAAALDGADTVVTMLHDAAAIDDALAGVAAASGTVWLQTSTVGIEGAARLAHRAEALGWTYVDCPVLGTKAPAENGSLVVLASGPDEARAAAQPVFDAIGSRTIWLGPAGAASKLKLVVNAWVQVITVGTAQSVELARRLDLDPSQFLAAIEGAPTDSPYAHIKGAAILNGDFSPSFSVSGAAKDAALIDAAVAGAGMDDSLAAAVQALFERAGTLGHGDADMAAVVHALRER